MINLTIKKTVEDKVPIFQLRKVSKTRKGRYDQYLLTLPKAYGETLTSIGVKEILLAIDKIGVLVPVTNAGEAEEAKRRIYARFGDIEELICGNRTNGSASLKKRTITPNAKNPEDTKTARQESLDTEVP